MKVAFVLLACVFLSGCAVGPNYKRPVIQTPETYRQPDAVTTLPSKESLAEVYWPKLFNDEVLTKLVKTAVEQNNDLAAASERVLQARAQLGVTRSQFFPQVDAQGQFNAVRPSSYGQTVFVPKGTDLSASYSQAGFNVSWELDFWGRIRRLNEAARAQFLSSEHARRSVLSTLVADVISNYLTLRELDLELEIARKTKEIGENGLKLTELRHQRGVATALDVRQAQQLLYTATAQIAATQRSIAETENAMSLLLGQNPGDIARGRALVELTAPSLVPAGLTSDLLERRPDIRQAEETLIAANAQIGAAKAEYFPQITLTGFLGGQSRALSSLFIGPSRYWSVTPAADLPIFNAGRIRSNVRLTEAQQREMLANYRKSIQTAFQEVANALADYGKNREQRSQEELLVEALRDTDRLSQARYKGGLDSYLQVLDAERNLFQGELTLAQLRKNELLSIVQLYRALGGGWQQP
jgi:multidrug efflux system outer membrane protein